MFFTSLVMKFTEIHSTRVLMTRELKLLTLLCIYHCMTVGLILQIYEG